MNLLKSWLTFKDAEEKTSQNLDSTFKKQTLRVQLEFYQHNLLALIVEGSHKRYKGEICQEFLKLEGGIFRLSSYNN